ncbi:MAG: GNAT family N-acetyltransferase [Thermoleophilia bacterium]|nr:GNAT family N-acetyltransferase [Thermoleophilia bacterium]
MPTLIPPDPPLSDDALALRVPSDAFLADVAEACSDPEIARWTTVPDPYTEADGRAFLALVDRDWAEGNAATFMFARHGAARLDGMVSLSFVADGIGVVGYWTAPWARGEGLATRALVLITGWGLGAAGLARIDLATLLGNRGSERVAQKAGYAGGQVVPRAVEQRGVRRPVRLWHRTAS